ncbi:MAG: glycosyltransferase, partial [Solirubrobacterales bacterium]|nr:glycosyltransferase [Solirubrobacterales bacterium]
MLRAQVKVGGPTALVEEPLDRRVVASVLVPVLNEERHIGDAVTAMRRQRFDGELEFIFVDGRSTDRTRQLLTELQKEDDRVRILDNPTGRTPAALNIALREARGDFIVRMDAHTLYPPDYVARGVERLQRGDADWVSGFQVPVAVEAGSRRTVLALGTWLGRGGSQKWSSRVADGSVPTGEEIELDTGVFAGIWRRET